MSVSETILPLPVEVQRVFQVGSIKRILASRLTADQQKTVTAKLLKAHYDRNLEVKSGEAVTEHFLSTALALWNSWFSYPRLKVSQLNMSQPALQALAFLLHTWSLVLFSFKHSMTRPDMPL